MVCNRSYVAVSCKVKNNQVQSIESQRLGYRGRDLWRQILLGKGIRIDSYRWMGQGLKQEDEVGIYGRGELTMEGMWAETAKLKGRLRVGWTSNTEILRSWE